MHKSGTRAVIKYFVKKGWKTSEIPKDMNDTLSYSAPSLTTVHKWMIEFINGCDSQENDPRSERPKTDTKPGIVEQVHDVFIQGCRLKVSEIFVENFL